LLYDKLNPYGTNSVICVGLCKKTFHCHLSYKNYWVKIRRQVFGWSIYTIQHIGPLKNWIDPICAFRVVRHQKVFNDLKITLYLSDLKQNSVPELAKQT
jgi:hypothetical protein